MPLHLILYSKIFKDYIMKRIIMFKGGVETLEFFSVEIAEYLESKGYEIFWYNLLLSKNSFNELMHYYNNHCNEQLYAITFNFEGLEGEEGLYNNDGWNFWDYSGVTVINIVVDHPLYYNQFHIINMHMVNIDLTIMFRQSFKKLIVIWNRIILISMKVP